MKKSAAQSQQFALAAMMHHTADPQWAASAFETELLSGSKPRVHAAFWNLLYACGVELPEHSESFDVIDQIIRSAGPHLDQCQWFQAWPEAVKEQALTHLNP